MSNRLPIFIVLLSIILAPTAPAQENVRFRHLSIEDGLSQSTVEAIVQDQAGFMWFGTEDGLNRYDGYTFTQYRHDPDTPGSISDNNIWCLHVDRHGYLWAGTYSGGLNRYDPVTETFTRFVHDPADPHSISSNRIRSIAEDEGGDLWIGTRDGGLNRLPVGSQQFSKLRHDPEVAGGLPSDNVRFVLPDSGSVLWIATNRGFSRFDAMSGEFVHHRAGPEGSNSIRSNNVRHLFRDREGLLWIATGGGLASHDPRSGRFINHVHDPADPSSISTDNLRKSYEDRQGRLWISTTNGGLGSLDRQRNSFTAYLHDQADPRSLSNNSVRVTFQDDSGILWVGTIGGGLNIYDPRTGRFRHFSYDSEDPNSLNDPIVWAVAEGPAGDPWFGTQSGLDRYNRESGRFEHYLEDPDDGLDARKSNFTRCLYWDDAGLLWVGRLYRGVEIYDPGTGEFTKLKHRDGKPVALSSVNVRAIYEDGRGSMWFGTWGGGLDNYDRTTGAFRNFSHRADDPNSLSHDNVISLLQDSEGVYWVATARGLNRLAFAGDQDRPEITRFLHDPDDPRSLSNSYVLSIYEAGNGDLWFGTMLGLSRLLSGDRDDPVFTRYFMKDGLPSDVVYGILEDDDGKLWLSTNYGISRFDPVSETFRNYDTGDGLHGNEFNTGAYARTTSGTFIFAGVNGASEFHPASMVDNPYAAPVVLTGFNIFDKPARLDQALMSLDEITLSYRDNFFSFEFAALDYATSGRNRYAYMLEGLDRDWTDAGTRNYVGYTRVDAGSYTFRVKGTNGDGVWNDVPASIRIVITPPFWKTWWFILLLTLAVGGGIAVLITARVRQLLAIERLRSKIAADLHDDIGAGLTEIALMGHIINQKLAPEPRDQVQLETAKITATARGLAASMRDIVWLVDPGRDSLHDLISRLSDSFRETLHALDIQFETENLESLESARLKMEHRQHLLLIFKEAINNSLKYSGCSEMHLKADLQGRNLKMRLSDNGKGFDTQAGPTGNGLGNMQDRARRIGGEVTIQSAVGEGTTVEFNGAIR